MVIATHMPMPTVMGMPMSMCTGTSTIGKHAARMGWGNFFGKNLLVLRRVLRLARMHVCQ